MFSEAFATPKKHWGHPFFVVVFWLVSAGGGARGGAGGGRVQPAKPTHSVHATYGEAPICVSFANKCLDQFSANNKLGH